MLREFLQRLTDKKAADTIDPKDVRIAAALLMIEVGQADDRWEASEIATVITRLSARFGLDETEARVLFDEARQRDDTEVSLYPTLKIINQHFTARQKREILTDCWRVAFADGKLDHYEEHQIRRIAELLHLPHNQFIQAKFEAEADPS